MAGRARQQLQGFRLPHGRVYPGKKGWTGAYRRWPALVRFSHPAQQIVVQDYIDAVVQRGFAVNIGDLPRPPRTIAAEHGGQDHALRRCSGAAATVVCSQS